MKSDDLLLTVAVAAVVISILATSITYFSVANLLTRITAYATSTGEANLTVEQATVINFTTSRINWSSGRNNQSIAQLTTIETNNVTGGNWTLQTAGGFRIENIGNVNVTLQLLSSKTAAQFIGGTSPGFEWNVTAAETGSCVNSSGLAGNINLTNWVTVNVTSPGTTYCANMSFYAASDVVRIDLNLTVPENSLTGSLTSVLTATATLSAGA